MPIGQGERGMALTNAEFSAMLEDTSKRISGDIEWREDEDHSPVLEFRASVESDTGWPLFVRGSYNRLAGALTYALVLKTEGRIYALDLGKDHHNPQCNQVGEKHKHRWTEQYRDKEAYVPDDITSPVTDPVAVWEQFCAEACIEHMGTLPKPPATQEDMGL
jgi:hypothetical protein